MDKNPDVVKLCVGFAEAMSAGDFVNALEIGRKGLAEHPDAELPRNSTWSGLIKYAENAIEEAAKKAAEPASESGAQAVDESTSAPEVAQPQDESLPPAAGPFTVFDSDGKSYGEDSDLEVCKEVAAELGDGAVVRDRHGALLWPLPQAETAPRTESMREKLARLRAEKARQVQAQAQATPPVADPEPSVRELTITHDAVEGTNLRGTAKGDGANDVIKPLGWRFWHKAGTPAVWYIPQSKGFRSRDDKIAEAQSALIAAGFVVKVEVNNLDPATGTELPVKLTAEQRAAQKAAQKAARVESARKAAEAAAAARQAVDPEVAMPGLDVFAAAAATLAQAAPAVPAAPVPAMAPAVAASVAPSGGAAAPVTKPPAGAAVVHARGGRKQSVVLKGLASLPGALWWRMEVKKGVSPGTTATAVRQAIKTVIAAHESADEEDLKVEVRLNRDDRTLLIGVVLPEREKVAVDVALVDVQIPAIASLMVPGVGTMIERHSDFC